MKRAFHCITRIIPEDSVVSHDKGSTWCLGKSMFQGCFPLKQILQCLRLEKEGQSKQRKGATSENFSLRIITLNNDRTCSLCQRKLSYC